MRIRLATFFNRLRLPIDDLRPDQLVAMGLHIAVAVAAAILAWRGYWPVALVIIAAAELWPVRQRFSPGALLDRATPFIIGAGAVLIIALLPKFLAQVGAGALYVAWAMWRARTPQAAPISFVALLAVQALVFEAVFLMAAIWNPSRPLVLLLVWLGTYITVYQALRARGERSAGVLAAAWSLVAAEASWIFLTWLVSYIVPGAYVIVPQATLVLTALAYCFGNIYLAQRSGTLNRARFTEYILIGLILIWVVIAGTQWEGTLE